MAKKIEPPAQDRPIEWVIVTNSRGEVVNSYPKAQDAGK